MVRAAFLTLLFTSGAVAQPAASADVDDTALSVQLNPQNVALDLDRVERLSSALRTAAHRFDPVSYLAAQRSMLVAVFEAYCAVGFLLPPSDENYEVALGAGCLIGAATLAYMTYRGFSRPRAGRDAQDRLERFIDAREGGLTEDDLDAFEGELRAGARKDRRRRWIGFVYGMLNLAATATLAGLTARDQIGRTPGTVIASGTAAVGVLGISSVFLEGSSEYAWNRF